MTPIISLQDIAFSYPERSAPVLSGLHFDLSPKERVGIIGPNGQGKTTFLHLCVGLLKPDKGLLTFKGEPVGKEKDLISLRRAVGLVFQNPEDQLFCPTVLEDVAFGPLNLGLDQQQAKDRALWALDLVGLQGFERRITHKLSGGEKKVLALATILAMQPEALLLDEPTTGLDPETRQHIMDIVNGLDQSLVIVSHDWDFLDHTTDVLYTLDEGRLVHTDKGALHEHVHFHPSGHIPHEHKNGLNPGI
jgi:cobalt/nickel transport system ATP-binding protein